MNASFMGAIDKWGYSYHHLILRQCNFYDLTAFELKNNLFRSDVGSHGLFFPVPLVSEGQRLVCIKSFKLAYESGFVH